MTLRVGSLFSGCGGFDLGFVRAGFTTIWGCEIDPQARAVFRRHHPEATLYHDIQEVNGETLEPVDVLIFGSPCQDLSVAGKRAGLAGERSGLFMEAMRIVDQMAPASRPRVAIWENVPGALSSNGGKDFGSVLWEMGSRWSGIAYRVLDLQWFGVPQRRRRVFAVGHSGGFASAAQILFEPQGMRWNPPSRRKAGQGSARGLEIGPAGGRFTDLNPTLDSRAKDGPIRNQLAGCVIQPGFDVAATLKGGSGERGWSADDCAPLAIQCYRVHGEHSTAMTGKGVANVADPVEITRCLDSCGGYATNQGGNIVAHTLRGRGFDGSEDGTGRGTPLVVFDTTQITSKGNYSNPRPGDPCHPLAAQQHAPAIAFTQNQCGDVLTGNVMPSMGTNQNATGRNTPKVLTQTADTLTSHWHRSNGAKAGNNQGVINPVIEVAGTLNASGAGTSRPAGQCNEPDFCVVQSRSTVRRLTPTECERLQGWPDGYTAWGIDDHGKRIEMSDSARYRMIGNGVGAPVAEWIARNINMTEKPK